MCVCPEPVSGKVNSDNGRPKRFYTKKTEHLPRQAQDKHRENSKKRTGFCRAKIGADVIDSPKHRAMNFEAALQSVALLRNDKGVLPLKPGTKVAVVGPLADARNSLMSGYTSMQPCAHDVNQTEDACIWSIAAAVRSYNGGEPGLTTNASGIDINSTDTSRIAAAVALAQAADVVVLALGTDSTIEAEVRKRKTN
jgi:hypothetical protein